MADADDATKLVVALAVAGIMLAFLMPVAIGAISGTEDTTATQAVDETVELQPGLNATVTGVTADTSATYTVEYNNDSVTGETVNEGSNSTVTVGGEDVTIAPSDVTATNATTTYTHSRTAGWGDGAAALWVILPVILVLAGFLYLTFMALQQFD